MPWRLGPRTSNLHSPISIPQIYRGKTSKTTEWNFPLQRQYYQILGQSVGDSPKCYAPQVSGGDLLETNCWIAQVVFKSPFVIWIFSSPLVVQLPQSFWTWWPISKCQALCSELCVPQTKRCLLFIAYLYPASINSRAAYIVLLSILAWSGTPHVCHIHSDGWDSATQVHGIGAKPAPMKNHVQEFTGCNCCGARPSLGWQLPG